MNLFELFVKIGVDDQASDKLSELSGKLGSGLKTAAKIGTAAVGAAATGLTALTTAAVNNYSDYEQLVGGVETLFKASSDTVLGYAENAYKTAGLSANDYMETVTSFSASLLQSLDNDTAKAAEKADIAITDMADNANKMGTSMEAIQNAYQGFAKQNYTMLDNLKLGYGGTKSEMERLLKDAEEIKSANGEMVTYSIDSFADMVDAIHVVQDNMGITGTTALEAGTTIQGSVSSMKTAWTNLVTGLSDGSANVEGLVNNLITTIAGDGTETNLGVIGTVIPAIQTALSSASTMISTLVPVIVNEIPNVINQNLPMLAEAAVGIIQSIVDGISQNQESLTKTAFETIAFLSKSLISMLPQIVKLGLDVIVSLANGIVQSLPELLPTIVDVVYQIVETLTNPDTLTSLVDAATAILLALSSAIVENLPTLIPMILGILSQVVETLTNPDTLVLLVDAAISILLALADGLVDAIPLLVEAIPTITGNLISALIQILPKLNETGITLILKLIEGILNPENLFAITQGAIKLIGSLITGLLSRIANVNEMGEEIFNKFKDGIMNFIKDPIGWGKDLLDNFIKGIKDKIGKLKETVTGIATSIKNLLGFSEPKEGPLSNFHTYAPDMMELFAKGVKDNEDVVVGQIEKTFNFKDKFGDFGIGQIDMSGSVAAGAVGVGGVSVVQNIYSEAKTAADLMEEALYQQERAVMFGV